MSALGDYRHCVPKADWQLSRLKLPCLLATPKRLLPVEHLSLITGLGRQAVGHVIESVAVHAGSTQ
jgi:hypothetical protein